MLVVAIGGLLEDGKLVAKEDLLFHHQDDMAGEDVGVGRPRLETVQHMMDRIEKKSRKFADS